MGSFIGFNFEIYFMHFTSQEYINDKDIERDEIGYRDDIGYTKS